MVCEYDVNQRPTLVQWLDIYASIKQDCLRSLEDFGIAFGAENAGIEDVRAIKIRLREKGARFRNGEASISCGPLSPACLACSNDVGSKTFVLSLECNRSCYFCFNANQDDDQICSGKSQWQSELECHAASVGKVTHVGLSGGEPLLYADEAVKFVATVHEQHPEAYVRLYTAGDFLDEVILGALRDAGLNELRLSVKLDVRDGDRAEVIVGEACRRLTLAKSYIPCVMVEMPAIPGTNSAMKMLLKRLDAIGVFGINLLEFGYPLGDWTPFAERGFVLKNPPFEIPYDYTYPAGLAIEGSELLCLELLEFALDCGLDLGVHYCSLENKNRGQVYRQNVIANPNPAIYNFDDEDFFYKALKVFDGDVAPVRMQLDAFGLPYVIDGYDGSLAFHPTHRVHIDGLPVKAAVSYNIVENVHGLLRLRELSLKLCD